MLLSGVHGSAEATKNDQRVHVGDVPRTPTRLRSAVVYRSSAIRRTPTSSTPPRCPFPSTQASSLPVPAARSRSANEHSDCPGASDISARAEPSDRWTLVGNFRGVTCTVISNRPAFATSTSQKPRSLSSQPARGPRQSCRVRIVGFSAGLPNEIRTGSTPGEDVTS
jgi:hypothetical protein